jgi:hypothetical protein
MPRYVILPTDQTHSSAEMVAPNPGSALDIVSRLDCREADVLEDGSYLFSVRKSGGTNFWHIFQRPKDLGMVTEFG